MSGRHQPVEGADSPAALAAALFPYVCAYHRDGSGWDECSSDYPCDPSVRLDRIFAPAEDDWTCLCGNTAWAGEGFFPCLADGTSVEPDIDGPWEGKLVKCERCDRIMDQSTWNGDSVAIVKEVQA